MLTISDSDSVTIENIKLSASGREWIEKDVNNRDLLTIIQKCDVPEIIAKILVAKNILYTEVEDFLKPTIKRFLPNPFLFKDVEKGARRIADAIINKEKIAIFGDYDVDGATSSALLKIFFRELGSDALIYIPDRIKEGYGPNIAALNKLQELGSKVVITVDCGTLAIEVLEQATQNGLDIIVLDHHLADVIIPKICAVINPNRVDEISEYKYLAAVGVTFIMAVAIIKILRELNYFTKEITEPNLLSYLDLVALGTVCDVVPLIGLNRAFVKQGIKVLSQKNNIGIRKLIEIAKVANNISTYHLGYILGPRINAGGRVGEAELGSTLLSTDDAEKANQIVQKLDLYNNERKVIEQVMLEQAIKQCEKSQMTDKVLVIEGDNWHQGVIGIIAGKLKEKYNLPVAVIALDNNIGKASCRSIKGFDFGANIVNAKIQGIVESGGGHAMAAGFTIKKENISSLKEYLNNNFSSLNIDLNHLRKNFYIGKLSVNSITLNLAKLIEQIGPFGAENYEPRFIINNVRAYKTEIIASEHIKVLICDAEIKNKMIMATAFRAVNTKIGEVLISKNSVFDLIVYLRLNYWNDSERVEIIIEDVVSKNL